ncbi:MAG: hypothetical protein AAGF12_11850 [Myxococcota bacterium]
MAALGNDDFGDFTNGDPNKARAANQPILSSGPGSGFGPLFRRPVLEVRVEFAAAC